MTAQPVHDFDPDDPVEIMRVPPSRYHGQFLAEYDEAAASDGTPIEDLVPGWAEKAAAAQAASTAGADSRR
jgi:hypothetical protein